MSPGRIGCDGRVVKALDLKSNGIFPRRFEPYSQRQTPMHTFPSWQRKATIKKMKRLGICQPPVVHDPFFMQATQGTESVAAEIAQLGERQTEDLKVPGSIPGFGTPLITLLHAVLMCVFNNQWSFFSVGLSGQRNRFALTGNRTPVSRVAGENSTTEPSMRIYLLGHGESKWSSLLPCQQPGTVSLHVMPFKSTTSRLSPGAVLCASQSWLGYRLKYSHYF